MDSKNDMAVALHHIDPSLLLAAIKTGAKPRTDDHLSPETEHEREELAASMRLKHAEEAKLVKATAKQLGTMRDLAHYKVEDHLTAETEHEREELAASMRLKHAEEAKQTKAARRRLEALRDAAHPLVEDHLTADEEAMLEEANRRKVEQAREARRRLKAHQRKVKALTAHVEPKVCCSPDKSSEHSRQIKQQSKKLGAMRAGEPAGLSALESMILEAARRGSLARTLKTPPSTAPAAYGSSARSPRKAIADALNNRLSQRRQALCGPDFDYLRPDFKLGGAEIMSF